MDGLITTPIDVDGMITTPVNSADCYDTNVLDDAVDILMMLVCRSILQDWCFGINVMMLEKWSVVEKESVAY